MRILTQRWCWRPARWAGPGAPEPRTDDRRGLDVNLHVSLPHALVRKQRSFDSLNWQSEVARRIVRSAVAAGGTRSFESELTKPRIDRSEERPSDRWHDGRADGGHDTTNSPESDRVRGRRRPKRCIAARPLSRSPWSSNRSPTVQGLTAPRSAAYGLVQPSRSSTPSSPRIRLRSSPFAKSIVTELLRAPTAIFTRVLRRSPSRSARSLKCA